MRDTDDAHRWPKVTNVKGLTPIVIGIDPDLSGAVAIVGFGVRYQQTPTMRTGKGGRREYDLHEMRDTIRKMQDIAAPAVIELVCIERSIVMPKNGAFASHKTGHGFGAWLALTLDHPTQVVHPKVWQRSLYAGIAGEGKERSVLAVKSLFPGVELPSTKAKRHGVCDALLIAEWGRRQLLGVRC